MPNGWTNPLASDATANGSSTYQAAGSITRYADRTTCKSRLTIANTARTRKTTTAPSHPTDVLTCTVRANRRTRGDIIRVPRPVARGRHR
ncbi:hypothetical protein ACFQ1L_33865 [Phytohabitans flavus]|uniref:hypothetical protein n=1 Tax=Phytohabitans flavus TaxID=1076124 RepID=UPI0036390A53